MEEPVTPRSDKSRLGLILIIIVLLLLIAGLIGWMIGQDNTNDTQTEQSTSDNSEAVQQTSAGRVTDLVEFDVPGGWNQESCEDVEDVIYFVESSEDPDCAVVPQSSITLAVDPANHTDCNQLQNVSDVSKHICRSIFIDNHKTLEASTVYNQASDVLPNRTVDAYYLDTGKGVVVARYIHGGSAEDGTIFNSLVQSLRVRD